YWSMVTMSLRRLCYSNTKKTRNGKKYECITHKMTNGKPHLLLKNKDFTTIKWKVGSMMLSIGNTVFLEKLMITKKSIPNYWKVFFTSKPFQKKHRLLKKNI